jgi:hypothetical protein
MLGTLRQRQLAALWELSQLDTSSCRYVSKRKDRCVVNEKTDVLWLCHVDRPAGLCPFCFAVEGRHYCPCHVWLFVDISWIIRILVPVALAQSGCRDDVRTVECRMRAKP